MIRIAIAAIAIVLALAGAIFSFRAQGASCLTLAQAKIETAQWQAVKVIEPSQGPHRRRRACGA
jgi:hypothetical protein